MAAALMPPDSREHVIGDLCESYTSPGRFAADVLRSLPFVLITRIRHTTVFALWPFLGVMLIGFLGVGPGLVWLRGLVPALAVLVGYMLRDAYRVPDPRRRWRQGLVDATVVAGFVAASQILTAWVAPALVMTRVGAVGFIFVMNILTLLRAMNPARNGMPVPQPCAGAVSLLELQRRLTEVQVVHFLLWLDQDAIQA